jgi:hypothetical protein
MTTIKLKSKNKNNFKIKPKTTSGNKNMGMSTFLWGPFFWMTIHTTCMGFPFDKPTKIQKSNYKRFFKSMGDVLPCGLCRTSYKKFLKEIPLNTKVLSSRKNLFIWSCEIHNKVNKKLGCKIFTKKQMIKKYKFLETFRASCSKDKLGCRNTVKKNNKKPKIVFVTIKNKKGRKMT